MFCPKCGLLVHQKNSMYPYQRNGVIVCSATCFMMICIAESAVQRSAQGGIQLTFPFEEKNDAIPNRSSDDPGNNRALSSSLIREGS